ncbi:DUF6779 domain-containing protein [Mycolicibacterium sp. CBM1]
MTVLSRGARNRRGGRRPGWLLLTVLLVLAIAASSALVFTNRVELLKLAVILSLWAAVVGAFVSVIYRRQSDIDAARARDLKLVYDLQLDREISARREYELSVESHLRRELASELRAQAADEVAALRAELAALRTNLEILFDADLGDRPALEGDRSGAGRGDWTQDTTTLPPTPGRVQSSRITPVRSEDTASRPATAENPIIDVPEEPLAPPPPAPQPYAPPPPRRRAEPEPAPADNYRGSHRRAGDNGARAAGPVAPPVAPPAPQRTEAQPQPQPEPVRPQPAPQPAPQPEPRPAAEQSPWRPVAAEDRRPGRHWTPEQAAGEPASQGRPEPVMQPPPEPAAPRSRHGADSSDSAEPGPSAPAMSAPPAPRHRGGEQEPPPQVPEGQHAGGQSVAELLARLQANGGPGGGRRRRRED